jgi:misacylated tRNA(Ala) deacylase
VLQVILHDTIIFPEGGGQPSDIGFIAISNGDLWEVKEVKRVGGHAIHFVQLRSDVDVEAALKLFSPGVEVTVSLGEEGFKRRLDHVCVFFGFLHFSMLELF